MFKSILPHPPERSKRDCIKIQFKVIQLMISGAIIIRKELFENVLDSSKIYGNELLDST